MSIAESLRHRAALARAFGHRTPRPKPKAQLKAARFPAGARTAYLGELLAVIAAIRAALDRIVVPELPRLVALFARGQLHSDSRFDALYTPALFRRIAIIGGPRTGKTTAGGELAARAGLALYSSDDLIARGWSEASSAVAEQIAEAGDHFGGVFEGVAVVRALRKLLKASPDRPVESVIVLLEPRTALTEGQRTMAEGTRTIIREVLPALAARGVHVSYSLAEHLEQPEYAALAQARRDAMKAWRTDADPSDPLGDLFDQVANDVDQAVPAARIAQAAGNAGNRVAQHVRAEVDGQVKQVVGIDVFGGDKGLSDHMSAFVRQQLVQVQSLTTYTLNRTHAAVFEGLRQGLRAESLAAKLREEVGLSKTKATIIANDQVGKLNGELTRLRQTNLGIKRYTWITARDELVRPGHRALDGTVQSWASPPVVNIKTGKRAHPGFDTHFYPCRCSATPVVTDLLEGIDDDDDLIVPKVPTVPPANVPPPAPAARPGSRRPKPEPSLPPAPPAPRAPAAPPAPPRARPLPPAVQALADRFKPQPLSPEVAKRVFGGPADVRELLGADSLPDGYHMVVHDVSARTTNLWNPDDKNAVEIRASIVTSDGLNAGTIARQYTRTENGLLEVKHSLFTLTEEQQGAGIGKAVFNAQVAYYKQIGVDVVKLEAAWVGKYVWPKAGFEWTDAEQIRDVRRKFKAFLADKVGAARGAKIARTARTAYDVSRVEVDGERVGKAFLLGLDDDITLEMAQHPNKIRPL